MDNTNEFNQDAAGKETPGFIVKNLAGIIDGIVVIIIALIPLFLVVLLNPDFFLYSKVELGFIFFLACLIFYRAVMIFAFSGTLGMLATRQKFMNHEYEELNPRERLLAALMIYIDGVDAHSYR